MEPNLLEYIVKRLNEAPTGTATKIAAEIEFDYNTILRIARGDIKNPRFETLEAIRLWFLKSDQETLKSLQHLTQQ